MSFKSILAVLFASSFAACAANGGSAADGASATANDTVAADATVTFANGDWSPTWSGDFAKAWTLKVNYDFDRLPQCRNTSRVDSWVVEMNYRFDGGETHTVALPGSPGAGETSDTIDIPSGSKSIELWFENHAVGGYDSCSAWDSQFGANYKHDL